MIYPDFLQKNDTIGITAPSDGRSKPVDIKRLESAEESFENRGYKVVETDHVRCSERGRSADGITRGREFMGLVKDESVKAIFCASGGDWLYEMLEHVDYEEIARNPKWVEGMSDPTGLTFTITTMAEVATVYCANAGEFGMKPWDETLENNFSLLEGKSIIQKNSDEYQSGWLDLETGYEPYNKDSKTRWKLLLTGDEKESDIITSEDSSCEKTVSIKGRMIGGCFDVLANLVGTKYDKVSEFVEKYKGDGILWYLEVFCLTPEQISFALWQMKEAGWFKYTKGFVFGRPAMVNEDYSSVTYIEALKDSLKSFMVPVIADTDIGHRPPHITIINGSIGKFSYANGGGTLETVFE